MARPTLPRIGKVRLDSDSSKTTKGKVRDLFKDKVIKRRDLFQKSKGYNVSIKNPSQFKDSVSRLRKRGITREEQRVLRIAKARAAAQILRPNISTKEKKQFTQILKTPIPKVHTITNKIRKRDSYGRFY